jgi:CHRD domain
MLAAVGMVAALALPAVAPGKTKKVELHAHLTGAEEAPGPGDADGAGLAEVTLKPKKKKVCFDITHTGLSPDEPFAGHIHEGPLGVAGPIVVTLFSTPSPSPVSACEKDVKKGLIKDIAKNPGGFYVNLHNTEFPGGAIRGQLGTD